MVKDDRSSCWTQSQRNKDPYLAVWIDQVPITSPDKAVWEFDRSDQIFKPYKWAGLAMNSNVPYQEIDRVFTSIRTELPSHPVPRMWLILTYLFLIHLPIVFIGVILLNRAYAGIPKSEQPAGPAMKFVAAVIGSSIALITIAICQTCSYRSKLKDREERLNRLLEQLTVTHLGIYQMRFVAGKCGAWVECQFLNPQMYMVLAGSTNLYANAPVFPPAGYNAPGYNPNNPFA